jgi:hypothetical protein
MCTKGCCSICFGEFTWNRSRNVLHSPSFHIFAPKENLILGLWDPCDEDTMICYECFRNVCLHRPREIISSSSSSSKGLRYFGPSGTTELTLPLQAAQAVLTPLEYIAFSTIHDHICSPPGTSRLICCPACTKTTRISRPDVEDDWGRACCCSWCNLSFCPDCTTESAAIGKKRVRGEVGRRDAIRGRVEGSCERCESARRVASSNAIQSIPGNQTCLLRWSGGGGVRVEPYNRYVRLLPNHRTPALRESSQKAELAMCLDEAAYCYPASEVPALALARHLVRVVTSPAGEVYGPICDVPIIKTSACNAIEHNGLTVCYVCQACTTPGDPFPQEHWDVCPRFDDDLKARALGLFGGSCEASMTRTRKRFATYAALRSVTLDTRRACLRILSSLRDDGAETRVLFPGGQDEREVWIRESPLTMPNLEELLRMDAHETFELIRLTSSERVEKNEEQAPETTSCRKRPRVLRYSSTSFKDRLSLVQAA